MISRYITKYSNIILIHLTPNHVRFPQTLIEREQTKTRFFNQYHLPGCLGIIDGTHIALSAVTNDIEHAYVNRKGFHSINVQIVCDDRMLITNDSYISLGSELFIFLRDIFYNDPNEMNFLLGNFVTSTQSIFRSMFHFVHDRRFWLPTVTILNECHSR